LQSKNVQEFLTRYEALFETMADGFFSEGRKYLTLAVGCTGGKHRSVAIAQELVRRLNANKIYSNHTLSAASIHRDLGREL
jgi:UPF0042 nucleotide-binding protein